MRIYRPRWVTKAAPPLALIVQDTAHAARSVEGLLPDLCHQAAFFAGGCRLPYWPSCNPPPRIEKVKRFGVRKLHEARSRTIGSGPAFASPSCVLCLRNYAARVPTTGGVCRRNPFGDGFLCVRSLGAASCQSTAVPGSTKSPREWGKGRERLVATSQSPALIAFLENITLLFRRGISTWPC